MIKAMLDTEKDPECPQCLKKAEFFEKERPVYYKTKLRVWWEGHCRKKQETQTMVNDTGVATTLQPCSTHSRSLGDKWVAAITAYNAAAKILLDAANEKQARLHETEVSDEFILDLVRNADRPPAGVIKFVKQP